MVAALFSALLGGCGGAQTAEQWVLRDDAPNVLLVSLDTVASDRVALYGSERPTLESLTELATRGAWFPDSYSQAPSTPPSHASMFTGRLPFEHQVMGARSRLADEEVVLAEVLQAHGWATASFVSSVRFHPRSGFEQGFDRVERVHERLGKNERSAEIARMVGELVEQEADRPWFVFAHLFDPHWPYTPPEPYQSRWVAERPEVADAYEAGKLSEVKQAMQAGELPEGVLEWLRDAYDGGLDYTDRQLEALVEAVEPAANGRPVLIVVTSDHGEEFGEHGHLGHSKFVHEEIIRVPLVIVLPGVIEPGTVVTGPVQNADLFPTILDLLGIEVPPTTRFARSQAGALLGSPTEHRPLSGFEDVIVVQDGPSDWGVIATLPSGRRFKLARQGGGDLELYDRDVDPRADRDIAADNPEVVATLAELVAKMGVESEGEALTEQLAPEVLEELRSLGYLD